MNGLFHMRASPVEEWDGMICTSQSVLDQVNYAMDLYDDYAARRHQGAVSPRPQTHLIPLGVHTDDFAPDPAAGQALRKRLGIGADDIVFLTLSRLSMAEKFDPLPIYRGLALAQQATGARVHYVMCGYFDGGLSEAVFRKGAGKAMPKVKLHVVDGKDAKTCRAALSAADVFLFLIDNVQETFGLAPDRGDGGRAAADRIGLGRDEKPPSPPMLASAFPRGSQMPHC